MTKNRKYFPVVIDFSGLSVIFIIKTSTANDKDIELDKELIL